MNTYAVCDRGYGGTRLACRGRLPGRSRRGLGPADGSRRTPGEADNLSWVVTGSTRDGEAVEPTPEMPDVHRWRTIHPTTPAEKPVSWLLASGAPCPSGAWPDAAL